MRINEMFNGAPKAPSNNQPESMYVEDSQPRLVVCYPGRFQPFHLGHRDVFVSLQAKFGRDHVYITTSNKTEEGRSPFNFNDKVAFMTASGVPVDRIIEERSPYKLPPQFNYEDTVFLLVCGEQDAYRLRPGTYKEDGKPSYYQKFESVEKCQTADKHAYVVIAKERKKLITIGGKQYDASHGTECRALWNKIRKNAKQRGEFLLQVFGRNDPELGRIMDHIDLDESYGDVSGLPVDSISPIHGGTVKENTEPSDTDLFGDQTTVIKDKVNSVINMFTKNVQSSLTDMLVSIGANSVDDIKNLSDAHESDIQFIIERVGLLKFLGGLKKAFDGSKEDGADFLRTAWGHLDPVVNFRGMLVEIPISEISDEFVSELRSKYNVDIIAFMKNLSESTDPDDEELFGKEEPIIFRLTRLLKNKQPVHIRLLNGKVWQVLEVHPEPSSKYYAQIVYGKLGPNGSRHGSMSMTKMLDQRKLSLTHANDGYMLTQNSADRWFVSDLSETSEPDDEELFGKDKLPLVKVYELLYKSKSVYIQIGDEIYPVFSIYMDENPTRRFSDSVTYIMPGYRNKEIDINQDEWTIVPYKNGHLLKKLSVNETTDPSDEELFGKRYEDRIADGMEDYAKQIDADLATAHPSWDNHEHSIGKRKEARAARQLADIFRKGGVEAGKGMINAIMKMPNYMWLYDLHDFMKDNRGINLHDLYGDARRLEENEPSDTDLFGGDRYPLNPIMVSRIIGKLISDMSNEGPSDNYDEDEDPEVEFQNELDNLHEIQEAFDSSLEHGLSLWAKCMNGKFGTWGTEATRLNDYVKEQLGVDMADVYYSIRQTDESTEPSDTDLFGDDYEVFDDPTDWQNAMGVQRRRHDIVRRDFLKDFTSPNGDICLYLRNDEDGVVGAFYAPQTSNVRIGTFLKYGSTKSIQDYITKDPHCPFNKLSEDAAGVGVVKNSKDPRYVMATMGDQNDVTADTMPRQLRAYGLTGRKPPKLGRERR